LFGDLIFDRANDPLIHVCDLLSFVSVTAFFADERIIREILVAQVNCGIRPRLSPTSQSVKHLSKIYAVQLKMKFFAHDGHNYLARFADFAKRFLLVRAGKSHCDEFVKRRESAGGLRERNLQIAGFACDR
jgi:hypothetical protein